MKHARDDYNRIQDPACLIPEDEPVFLIRGQDFAGPFAVEAWARRARKEGASPEIVQRAYDQAKRMRQWQAKHVGKVPDLDTPPEVGKHG
jgi:hypothetical protein